MFGLPDGVTACLFDMDGVVTQTAVVHAAAWKEMFDEFLRQRAESTGTEFVPFDPHAEYDAYVDGKPRLDGTRSFLESRGIDLPEGTPDDPPGTPTIYGLSNRKNDLVLAKLAAGRRSGVRGNITYIRAVRDKGISTAIVSSSANTQQVLDSAGIADLFDVRVDGLVAKERGLRGKPAPDTFLAAAEELKVPASHAAVFEDALAGVEAGRAGHFALVVGVDRVGQAERAAGSTEPTSWSRTWRNSSTRTDGPMIKQSAYGTEPWRLVEKGLDLDLLAQSESIFALSNGHIGLRGNLDEGDPHGLPGSYLNSVYEVRPLPYAEAGYGFPDDGQTVINVTNGKIIRLLVDDEPFDIRYGTLHSHERVLDLRAGTLTREVDWSSPAGARIKVTSVRMVSLTQRAIAAISYTVEPVDAEAAARAAVRARHERGAAAAGQGSPPGRHPGESAGQRGAPVCQRRLAAAGAAGAQDAGQRAADRGRDVPRDHRPGRRWRAGPSPIPTWAGSPWRPRLPPASSCTSSSTSATAGRASGPGPPSSTRWSARWRPPT